ncbi:MAG: hypothetical protein ACHRXM_06535 [Isosphaerales bacterium]
MATIVSRSRGTTGASFFNRSWRSGSDDADSSEEPGRIAGEESALAGGPLAAAVGKAVAAAPSKGSVTDRSPGGPSAASRPAISERAFRAFRHPCSP